MAILMLALTTLLLLDTVVSKCFLDEIYQPLAKEDGEYIIIGLFNIGIPKKGTVFGRRKSFASPVFHSIDKNNLPEIDPVNNETTYYCDMSTKSLYGVQKALGLREEVWEFSKKLKVQGSNVTIGYELYSVCNSFHVNNRISVSAMQNPKVIGVAGVDIKKFIKESSLITTTNSLPTFSYMYSDAELLNKDRFPTFFSMIDTEENEAKILINFLKELGSHYMDIWHHVYSLESAGYVYHQFLDEGEHSCGRIQQVSYDDDVENIAEQYQKTGGRPADVQLILGNNLYGSEAQLRYLIENIGLRNKVYILGPSNGRKKYQDDHEDVVKELLGNQTDETLIYQMPPLLNTYLNFSRAIAANWTLQDSSIDDLYRSLQTKNCRKNKGKEDEYIKCTPTSWIPFVQAGVRLTLLALNESLHEIPTMTKPCVLRDYVYRKIVNGTRNVRVELGNDVYNVSFDSGTFSVGVKFMAWSSSDNSIVTLGYGYTDRFVVSNKIELDKIRHKYSQICAAPCGPGTYRKFHNVKSLLCCWSCNRCDGHKFTNTTNEDYCFHCHGTEISNEDNTGCILVEDIFLRYDSPKFISGMTLIGLGLVLAFLAFVFVFRTEERPIIKASNPVFLYLLLFSIAFGILSSGVPLVRPSVKSCNSEFLMLTISLSLITSCLAWRCGSIYALFSAANDFNQPRCAMFFKTPGMVAITTAVACTNVVIVVILQQLGLGWKFVKKQSMDHGPQVHMCDAVGNGGLGYLTCLPFILPSLLFLSTLLIAFKMRNFPHNFRETSNIFIATLVVLFTCVMFLSGYNLANDAIKPFLRTVVVYVMCMAFLACIFLPKLVIIVKKGDIEEERREMKDQLRKYVNKSVKRKSDNKGATGESSSTTLL